MYQPRQVQRNRAKRFTEFSKVYKTMKIGFICPNIPGHLNPMTALARHLQERNHEVVFLYSPSAYWSGGASQYYTTTCEDSGIMRALTNLANAKKIDLNRVLVLRTASDF
jgi:hypothetical protein